MIGWNSYDYKELHDLAMKANDINLYAASEWFISLLEERQKRREALESINEYGVDLNELVERRRK